MLSSLRYKQKIKTMNNNIGKGKEFCFASRFFQKRGRVVVVKRIPCIICSVNDEIYYDEDIINNIENYLQRTQGNYEVFDYLKLVA